MSSKPGKTVKDKILDWATKKLGNPVMPSKEQEEIRKLEEEERRLQEEEMRKRQDQNPPTKTSMMHDMQERGEDYPARFHRRG